MYTELVKKTDDCRYYKSEKPLISKKSGKKYDYLCVYLEEDNPLKYVFFAVKNGEDFDNVSVREGEDYYMGDRIDLDRECLNGMIKYNCKK